MKTCMNELKAGTMLYYVNMTIGSIIPIIYTPIMLRMLGLHNDTLYRQIQSNT